MREIVNKSKYIHENKQDNKHKFLTHPTQGYNEIVKKIS
jgi:hypothetical protein